MPSKYQVKNPSRYIILVYITMILSGMILLSLPISSRGISSIDALFTATSAFCVTGLIVKDTAVDFTLFGKIVILILIQIGGLGYMAFSNLLLIMFRRIPNLRQRMVAKEEYGLLSMEEIVQFLKWIVVTTIVFEVSGMIVLFSGFSQFLPFKEALNQAVFHSVSAFCNAGFSTFSTNLTGFYRYPLISITVAILIIVGGIGFIVLRDIGMRLSGNKKFLDVHTRIVLLTTVILILVYTGLIILTEKGNTLRGLSKGYAFLAGFFTAITPRTAGFNLVITGSLLPITLLLVILGMFIGASPGGTGGGVKTTTFVVLLMWMKNRLKGRLYTNVFKRRISEPTLNKAFFLLFLSVLFIFTMTTLLTYTEKKVYNERGFLPLLFEEVSAFGTVGLSMGSSQRAEVSLAGDFTVAGKLILIVTMIFGRAGPLVIAASLFRPREEVIKYPAAKILIG